LRLQSIVDGRGAPDDMWLRSSTSCWPRRSAGP